MKDEIVDLYREAGAIASAVLRRGRDRVRIGTPIRETVESIEGMVREAGAGLAFPLNVSVNEDAAHDTAWPGDERIFAVGDVVKLDLGVHLEGYIADTATTVDLGEHQPLVEASVAALERAIGLARPGVQINQIGAAIEAEIQGRGFRPVANLTGHGLAQYQIHTGPTIQNVGSGSGAPLEAGTVIAIEPFATTGSGMVSERNHVEIYQQISVKPVRLPAARRLLEEVRERRGLPFARRFVGAEMRDVALATLVRAGILHAYPILHDVPGSMVSQAEHTIVLLDEDCIVTTR
ncbi:MAG: type II methionyl aminopeptidase [Methanobacteriota archaeon]|nr:MAG: type II methionyl aminopeptidase [Euryarchaeota archaeon]